MLPNALFLNVHMYGIMVAVGILCCFLVLYLYAKKLSIEEKLTDFVFYNGVASILVGFGCAALFQALYNYLEHPERGFRLGGGITFIGGLLGGAGFFLIIYFLLRKRLSLHLFRILPVIPCMITVGHAFGRVGCFFAGCCYGKVSDCIFAVRFPGMTEKVHPTQLYEAVFLFVLFAVLSWLLLRKKFRYTMSIYLISYGVFRFLLEFLRGDDRGKWLGVLSPSQFWSVVMVIIGIVWFFAERKLTAHADAATAPEHREVTTDESTSR